MDVDDQTAPPASHSRRPSAPHDRPSRAPFGPRIRTKPKQSIDVGPPSAEPPGSPLLSSPSSPTTDFYFSQLNLSPIHADAAVQVPSSPPPSPFSDLSHSPSPLPPPSPLPAKSVPTTFIPPPPLTPPPTVTFEPAHIPWKGLPLEVAQWTFSSSELQEIVSKAIRLSARESFVRLLSLQALEVDILHEQERLDEERSAAQAKWRFEVGRRTMLMQALNAVAASASAPTQTGTDPAEPAAAPPILGFVAQLAASISTCDSLMSSILSISDQQSQIEVIQHQHWASALGIALRKLNRAHERQSQELARALNRVQTLEDELEEAWREAEKMAIEFDDLEQEVDPDDHSGLLGATTPPQDLVPPSSAICIPGEVDDTATLADAAHNSDIAVVLGVTATAVASKATLVASSGGASKTTATSNGDNKSDSKSIRSTRSRRSTTSYVARLSAARIRSRTASNASLRLPKSLRSSLSHPSSIYGEIPPPMPALPPSSITGCSFLDMDLVATTHDPVPKPIPPKRHPEPTVALPTPPHSAGLPVTRVPSIWLDTDDIDTLGEGSSANDADSDKKRTRLNGLDRTHSLHIFSSLSTRSPMKSRRSNLVMSLKGSDRGSDLGVGSSGEGAGDGTSGSGGKTGARVASRASVDAGVGIGGEANADLGPLPSRSAMELGRRMGSGPASASSSPVASDDRSLLSLAAHVRGASIMSSTETGAGAGTHQRPGSAGARLTTTPTPSATPSVSLASTSTSRLMARATTTTMMGTIMSTTPSKNTTIDKDLKGKDSRDSLAPMPTLTPKRSLVSRAGSVILRRFSHATTTIGHKATGANGSANASGRSGGTGLRIGAGVRLRTRTGIATTITTKMGVGTGTGALSPSPTSSHSRSHEALRLSGSARERWKGKSGEEADGEGFRNGGRNGDDEGEVMVIGSLRSASFSLDGM